VVSVINSIRSHCGLFIRFIPALVLLVGGEAVQYVDLRSFDIVDYSCLPCHQFSVAGNALLHVFSRRRLLHSLSQ
jgi:hypothetical protein